MTTPTINVHELFLRLSDVALLQVSLAGSDSVAVYFKPRGKPYIVAKNPPAGTLEFRTRAWEVVNAKARELGWIA
jgi:hypothetical protein